MHSAAQEVFHLPITIREVVANILVATLCGTLLAIFYNQTHRGTSYSFNLVKAIIMLSVITSFVMMVIGDNLARAFGMVALISLIRFRGSIKGAQDFMFIYLALAIGLAAGVGLYAITLVGTLLIILITWVVMRFNLTTNKKHEFTLRIISESCEGKEQCYETTLNKFCKKHKLVVSKAELNDKEILTKSAYYIMLKNGDDRRSLLNELQGQGVKMISLQFVES